MTLMQKVLGFGGLGGIVLFAVYGIVQEAQAGSFRYVRNVTYVEECGACHFAYPPQLLPGSAWSRIMAGLDDHFGENAELDDETVDEISQYLNAHALGIAGPSRMSKMMRNIPDEPPLRITEYPAFLDAHEVVKEQLDLAAFETGFLSPCADCHRLGNSGIFDKELLHPGYGPSNWGGTPTE